MKIYKLPVDDILRPSTGFRAPAHNQDYGCEQDFEQWLSSHPEYLTNNPNEADWEYFPAYFNKFYCNHWGDKSEIIQSEILRLISRNKPTFTICEYDLKSFHPDFDFCNMVIFSGSRMADNGCIDIPLLCSPHQELPYRENRRWLATFMGKFETHGIREEMRQALEGRRDVYLSESKDTQAYIELMADSYIALAPRGYGGQSFRFYEAMQFGCVPMLIGDVDTRPFKKWIDWENFSFFCTSTNDLTYLLDLSRDNINMVIGISDRIIQMGQQAKQLWHDELHYGKWCKYVLKELASL